MKTFWQWASLCALCVALTLFSSSAMAQTIPTIQGTSVADPAVPVLVTPASSGSGFFVLNQDFSLLQHSTVDTSQNQSCAGPSIFSTTNPAARTLVTDLYNAYITGPDGGGSNTAITALTPEVSCTPVQAFDYTGGLATQSVSSNDPQHGLFYTVSAFAGAGGNSDQLIVLQNLNNATVSGANKFTELNEASLDIGGVYTSINSDTRSDFGLTAITELKTSTSPGNLWIYYPQTNFPYKILGPGGTPLPAVTSFIIPPQTDGGGSLLVLVNQDGLTASNVSSPPLDTTPFTIIDLGQLRPLLDAAKPRGTITLPFVTQIAATTSFYAMLGGVYNPLDHRVYGVVAGGTSTSNVVGNIISYDTLNPSAPAEQVVADVSNVPFSLGSYPQLALNAASGTMQILTSNPATVYTVGISGTGNIAVEVPGSTFPDSNFTPTYIAANPLQGETYIASSSGQVDVLTRPASAQGGLTLTLTGSDLGYTSQEYEVKPLALWPVYDDSLGTAKLTITVTPKGGTPVTLATGHVADVGYPGGSFYTYTFPAAGQYTIVATADASALYPAVTSPPLSVFVGNTGVYPTAITLSVPATAPATNGEAQLNATVTLTGTTYGPGGQVYIQDPTGAEVGNVQLPKGVIANPITVPITIGEGVQTLTASYSGDEQNQGSTSAPQTITVGTVAKVTPTFTVTLPGTAKTGASVAGNVKFTSSSTTMPTGTVTIYATLSGSTTANQIATVTAAQAFAAAGVSFSFTAPAAGSYTVFAGYGGDATYSNAVSPNVAVTITGATLQTTVIGIVAPATATAGTAFNVVVAFNVEGAFTTQPTGNIVLTATTAASAAITLGTITPAQGMAPGGANIPVTLANAGAYTLNANYAGDSLYAASSNMASVTVKGNAAATTLSVSGPANVFTGASFITTVTLRATGSPTAAITGNVTLMATGTGSTVNSYSLGTMPAASALASGGAQFTGSIPVAGTYSLAAVYAGDANYSTSSGSVLITVAEGTTTLSLSGATAQDVGVPFPLTVRLTPQGHASGTPTGNVMITATAATSGTTTLATITAAQAIASGGYQALVRLPAGGNFTVTATYAGDASFGGSTASLLVTATLTPTSMVLELPANATAGKPVDGYSFTLVPKASGGPVPTGNVVLTATLGGITTTYGSVTAATALSPSLVDLTLPTVGVYTVTVKYAGDANYGGSAASATINVSTLTVPVFQLIDNGPGVVSTPVDFEVNLYNTQGAANAPITITSTINGTPGPSTTVIGPMAPFTLTFTKPGTYTVVGSFPGDALNQPVVSQAVTTTIYTPSTFPNFTLQTQDSTLTADSPPIHVPYSGEVAVPMLTKAVNGFSGTIKLTVTAVQTNSDTSSLSSTLYSGAATLLTQILDAKGNQIGFDQAQIAAGDHFSVVVDGSAPRASHNRYPMARNSGVLACFLFGIFCLRSKLRKGTRGAIKSFAAIVLIACLGILTPGCGVLPHDYTVTVTAQSTDPTLTRTVAFPIVQDPQ